MLTLTPLVLQLIEMGVSVLPSLIAAARTEISLVTGTADPTDAQKAEIDAALDEANTALQTAQPGA